MRWKNVQIGSRCRYDGVSGRCAVDQAIIDRRLAGGDFNAKSGGAVGLRISIYNQDLLFQYRQAGTHIDRRGRLADPSFLICDGYYFSHDMDDQVISGQPAQFIQTGDQGRKNTGIEPTFDG